jgi:hypothetical protein
LVIGSSTCGPRGDAPVVGVSTKVVGVSAKYEADVRHSTFPHGQGQVHTCGMEVCELAAVMLIAAPLPPPRSLRRVSRSSRGSSLEREQRLHELLDKPGIERERLNQAFLRRSHGGDRSLRLGIDEAPERAGWGDRPPSP